MDDNDFEFSDSQFAEDNQLNILDSAKLSILNNIEQAVKETKKNLEFGEGVDYMANINIISRNMSALMELENVDDDLPEEELSVLIDKINKMTTTLTFGNIDEVLKSEDDEEGTTEMYTDDSSDGTDW